MSELETSAAGATGAEMKAVSLLDRALEATVQTPEDTTKELLSVLASQAMEGSLTWDQNVGVTIRKAVVEIDKLMSQQMSAIMQNKKFRTLEGSWRGLQKVVRETELGSSQKIRLVDYNKEELLEQFEDAPAVDRSPLFEALYQNLQRLQIRRTLGVRKDAQTLSYPHSRHEHRHRTRYLQQPLG